MTIPANAEVPGSALMPVADFPVVTRSADVVGTVRVVDGELVVRVAPPRVRHATTRQLPREPDPQPITLAAVSYMRYVGPLTPAEAAEHRRILAYCRRHPWWAWLRGWTR